jgi:hypothetical protein
MWGMIAVECGPYYASINYIHIDNRVKHIYCLSLYNCQINTEIYVWKHIRARTDIILSMFSSRSALIVSLQKLNESNNYEPISVTLKWFCFYSGYLGIIRHWCTSSHSAIIIFTFTNYYLHIHQLLSSHSAITIFTFSNYYLHIQ